MENGDVNRKRLSLIDVSFEDDCLINSPFSSSPFAQPSPSHTPLPDSKADEQGFDLEGASDSNLVYSEGKTVSFFNQDPKSSEKKEATKNKKYNLRTSLAWDSEFFTSEGVLDPDELSEGKAVSFSNQDSKSSEKKETTKNKKYNLRTSLAWDSEFFTSAGVLDSDELSSMIEGSEKMENRSLPRILEETQRSTDSISTLASDSLTIASDALTMASLENELDDLFGDVRASIQKSSRASIKNANDSKKTELTSNGKLKPKPVPKRLSAAMSKSGRPTNQGDAHARTIQPQLESLPSKKPPKAGSPSPVPSFTKRDSVGAHRLKVETRNAEVANSRRASSTKTLSDISHSILHRSSSSRNSPSSSASDKLDFMTSSVDSSVSGSSTSTEKSSMSSINKTDEAKPKKLSSVRSGLKTPARNMQTPIPKRVLPTTKLSTSSLSPASSTSDGSASLSSTSTPKQKSTIPRPSVPQKVAKERSGVPQMSNCSKLLNEQRINGHKTQGFAQSSVRSSSTTGTMAAIPNLMKPSGLRMPSPKIGFFDGVKSGRTATGSSPKMGKPQSSARSSITNSSTRVENTKLPVSKLAARTQEPSSLSSTEKDSGAPRSAKQTPSISPKIHTTSTNVEEFKSTKCNANGQETALNAIEVNDLLQFDVVLNARMPLTVVDSLCNMDDSLGVSAGFVAPRVEKKTESPSPDEGEKPHILDR